MTTISLRHRVINHRLKSISLPAINWKAIYVIGLALFFMLFLFYVISINSLTKGSYLIKSYQKQIDSLAAQNSVAQANLVSTGFLNQLNSTAADMGFEKIAKIQYVQILQNSLAKR